MIIQIDETSLDEQSKRYARLKVLGCCLLWDIKLKSHQFSRPKGGGVSLSDVFVKNAKTVFVLYNMEQT
jgi:hypothetical protein